ncbi:MAG: long-chain fatty acid--CoA ligase, partial [Rhodospirillaceae bacterium]
PRSYGTTETLAINCSLPSAQARGLPKECYGVPLPGNTLKIVNPITGVVVPRGERGEIGIKGPTLMMGYLGKTSEETLDAEGFYRTADGGYVDAEGRLFWEGRLSDIIRTGAANVSPVEVDDAISTYPGIKVTQTVGVPHETLGEIVVACIVPHEGAVIDEAALRDFLKQRLASYKVPRHVLVFRDDELSMTGGATKIKAGAVRQLAVERLSPENRSQKAS